MADNMEDFKLNINKDYAKKLHKQKEKSELEKRKFVWLYYSTLRWRTYETVRTDLFIHLNIWSLYLSLDCVVKQKYGDVDLANDEESSSSESEDDDARVC